MTPPRKKAKTRHVRTGTNETSPRRVYSVQSPAAPRRTRERVGAFARLPHLPLDILIEIFNHLHPRDLLSLARTSRDISRFVLGRQQEHIWRHAREHTQGIPGCPSFLSERAFAHFLFSPFCHGCGDIRSVKPAYTWYARYCPKCLPQARCNIAVYYGINEDLRDNEDFNLLFNIVNPDRDVFKTSKNRIQRRQLDAFARDWRAAETNEERKELIERQKRVVKERTEHAAACKAFCEGENKAQARIKTAVTKQRNEAIIADLCAVGYGQEIEYLRKNKSLKYLLQDSCLHSVECAEDLTTSGWERIREELAKSLEVTRALL
ncbi:hypothetical protein C8Q76DRAFT_340362 [Earliella scabrosa]|nr:hypothetical protein C8Q76DRAFT_340362 [Earliella scabrosa]